MGINKTFLCMAVLFTLALPALPASGAEDDYKKIGDVSVPEGMNTIKQADVNVLVPKGGQLQKNSSFSVTETPDEYSARMFVGVEKRFERIEEGIEELRESIKDLKESIEKAGQTKNESK